MPAQFARQVAHNGRDVAAAGPQISDAIARVNEDLKRSVAPMNAMRAAGSDTAQNLVGQHMLGQQMFQSLLGRMPGAFSEGIGAGTGKMAGWLYSGAGNRLRQLLVDAQLNPGLGGALMGRQIPARADLLGGLLSQMLPVTYGGLLGAASAQQGIGK
jgi:hypothetical protein